MLTYVRSAAIVGVDSTLIGIEVDAQPGLPREQIVGLPNTVVRESKDRVKSAIHNAGFEYPPRAYTINLSPADIRKEGALFDLPIAYGILKSTKQLDWEFDGLMVGELSLNGDITGVRGIISICILCRERNISRLLLPVDNLAEAQLISGIEYCAVSHLTELRRSPVLSEKVLVSSGMQTRNVAKFQPDFADIQGQYKARRAAEIAAAGWHNLLLVGPPGCGKSMIGQRMASILPPLSDDEAVEVLKIASVTDKIGVRSSAAVKRPFRSPHHTVSFGGMVGGGSTPRPGEITRAHRGVLFLDEFGEFPKTIIEILRQPLEDQRLTVSRAAAQIEFPADFLLVAATNPCPCGYNDSGGLTSCHCSPDQQKRFWRKISGPILDRFDLVIRLSALRQQDLISVTPNAPRGESSAAIQTRVSQATAFRLQRQQSRFNSRISPNELQKMAPETEVSKHYLSRALAEGKLSGRGYYKVLKVAKTIADLSGEDQILDDHILEAMQFRG